MLLIDWGNTRLKWALIRDGDVEPGGAVVHEGDAVTAVREIAADPERIRVASVASPDTESVLRDACAGRWPGAALDFAHTAARAHGLTCAYAEPSALGVDRWLAMIAARELVDGPVTVMDAGSAVTLDAVDEDGMHLGGLILPGAGMARQLLRRRTARVAVEGEGRRTWWADNTRDAVDSAARLAAVALAERFHEKTAERLGSDLTLVLTGGDAPAIMELLALPCDHVPSLVLQGLAITAREEVRAG